MQSDGSGRHRPVCRRGRYGRSVRSVLSVVCSSAQLPFTVVQAISSRSRRSAANMMATASSVPVSTSRISFRLGMVWLPILRMFPKPWRGTGFQTRSFGGIAWINATARSRSASPPERGVRGSFFPRMQSAKCSIRGGTKYQEALTPRFRFPPSSERSRNASTSHLLMVIQSCARVATFVNRRAAARLFGDIPEILRAELLGRCRGEFSSIEGHPPQATSEKPVASPPRQTFSSSRGQSRCCEPVDKKQNSRRVV